MNEQLALTISNAKINSGADLQSFLAKVEEQTISLLPKTMTFGSRPELILTTRLIYVNTELPILRFYSKKEKKEISYPAKSNGDIYLIDKNTKSYALHLKKLKEIAQAAGITTTPPQRDYIEYNSNGKPNKVSYSFNWERLDVDGSLRTGSVNGFYNYEQQLEKYRKDENDDDKNAEKIEKFVEKQRGDAEKLAIANAYSRAIKDALPQMPLIFTLDQLKKPLLVPSVIKDLSNLIAKYPDVEKMLLARELGISDMLYGAPKPQLAAEVHAENIHIEQPTNKPEPEDAQIINDSEPPGPVTPTANTAQRTPGVDNHEPTPDEQEKIQQKEWAELEQEHRTKHLNELITQKGFVRESNTPIEKMSIEKQYKFLKMLNGLEDKNVINDIRTAR